MQQQQIKVGEIYPGGCPAEGPVAQIRGGAFNVIVFQPDLTTTHIKLFKKHPLQTGVYIHESRWIQLVSKRRKLDENKSILH